MQTHTFQRMNNDIHLTSNQKLFKFLGPEILRRKLSQGNVGILVSSGLSGVDLKRAIRPCLFQGCQHQIRLEKSELRLARSDGEGLSRGRGVSGRRGRRHCDGCKYICIASQVWCIKKCVEFKMLYVRLSVRRLLSGIK